jgi:hypothetical protein
MAPVLLERAVTVTTMDVSSGKRRCQAPCFSLLRGAVWGGLVSLITRSKDSSALRANRSQNSWEN